MSGGSRHDGATSLLTMRCSNEAITDPVHVAISEDTATDKSVAHALGTSTVVHTEAKSIATW